MNSIIPLLEVNDLHASYGPSPVLRGISLSVGEGECVCVIGSNTAGKTTLLRSVARLIPISRGEISISGDSLMKVRPERVPEYGISHVPDGRQVFPDLTVRDNLMLGAFVHRKRRGYVSGALDNVYDLFPRLAERATQQAGSMSGGEQQMVAIGRALMSEPRLILFDEPSHGLAPIVVDEVFKHISNLSKMHIAVLLVEQNAVKALEVSARGYVLERGEIVHHDSANALSNSERVRQAYLGP